MKKFSKIFLIPIENDVEMRVGSDLARVYMSIIGKYLNLTQLKLVVFCHDRMVTIVSKEHDISLMLETINLIDIFVQTH